MTSLDHIEEKISAQKEEVDTALMSLPKLPDDDVQHVVTVRLQRFSNGVSNLLEGGPRSNGFLSSWAQLAKDFRDAIETIKPMFNFKDPSDMTKSDREIIDLDSSDDEDPVRTPTPNNRKRPDPFTSPQGHQAKVVKVKHDPSLFDREPSTARSTHSQQPLSRHLNGSPVCRRILQPARRGERSTVFDEFLHHGRGFMSIGHIRGIIRRNHPPGVPGHFDDAVYSEICLQAIAPWRMLLTRFAGHTFKTFREAVFDMLNVCLGDYQQTQLYRSSKSYLLKFLEQHEAEQRRTLQTLLDLESYKMFTVNDEVFEIFQAKALEALQEARKKHRQTCAIRKNPPNNKPIADPIKEAQEALKVDVGLDPFQKEIQVAAYVRGYYKVCGLRFSDNACQVIRGNLFRNVESQIMGMLENRLGLTGGNGKGTRFLLTSPWLTIFR